MAIVKISDLPLVDSPVEGTDLFVVVQDNVTKKAYASDIQTYVGFEEFQTATAGQTVFNLTTMTYAAGANNLQVFVDGLNQYVGTSYLETDNNTVTFTQGLHQGALLKFSTVQTQTSLVTSAGAVTFLQAGTGAVPRSVQSKERDIVSVKDFGAIGDGVNDDTAVIQAAVTSMSEGGILYFPPGKYRLTDEITIPPYGGLILQGGGGNDSRFGSPVPSADGTFIFQETNNKAIFVFGGGCSYSSIRDMTLSSTATPGTSWTGTNKFGIKIQAALPNVIWSLSFDRLVFFNLERGISCVDPNAGSNPSGQDLSVAPVGINQCIFTYNKNGVYIDTNNADYWTFQNCFFFIPSGGDGAYLKRFGLFFFYHCSAGGTGISNNRFINIEAAGDGSVDKILIEGCQTENLTNLLVIQPGGGYTYPFVIEINNGVFEMGSEISLSSPVHLITSNNRLSTANIYVNNANVKLSTYEDQFQSADFYFLAGSPSACFQNTVWGPNPSALYSKYEFDNGQLVRLTGSQSAVVSGVATTLFSLPVTAALYEVYAYVPNAAAGSLYMASSRIGADGGELAVIGGEAGANISISTSGSGVRVTQTSGVNQTIGWGYRRLT
jgi:hypothetical protein